MQTMQVEISVFKNDLEVAHFIVEDSVLPDSAKGIGLIAVATKARDGVEPDYIAIMCQGRTDLHGKWELKEGHWVKKEARK